MKQLRAQIAVHAEQVGQAVHELMNFASLAHEDRLNLFETAALLATYEQLAVDMQRSLLQVGRSSHAADGAGAVESACAAN